MGSAATGIPTGALVAASPLETLASFYAWSYEDDVRDVDRDGEVIGRLQVRLRVLFPFLFLCFSLFLKNSFFLCSFLGQEEE